MSILSIADFSNQRLEFWIVVTFNMRFWVMALRFAPVCSEIVQLHFSHQWCEFWIVAIFRIEMNRF